MMMRDTRPSNPCHPERNIAAGEANGNVESKGTYLIRNSFPVERRSCLRVRGYLPCIRGLALLQETLQPPKHALPSLSVAERGCRSSGKSLMTQPYQGARTSPTRTVGMQAVHVRRFQFPSHYGLELAAPTGDPRMDQQAGRIHFQILPLDPKRCAISADTTARPFATTANIPLPLADAIHTLLTPPPGRLAWVGDCLEHSCRRPAMKISATTAFWSGVIAVVAMQSP